MNISVSVTLSKKLYAIISGLIDNWYNIHIAIEHEIIFIQPYVYIIEKKGLRLFLLLKKLSDVEVINDAEMNEIEIKLKEIL